MTKSNYLVEGNDFISVQNVIKDLIIKNNFSGVDINSYDMDDVSLDLALEDLDTYGLFSNKKIIIINNIESINQEENKKNIDHLYQYLDNASGDNLLIICSKKLNNTLKFTKELKKRLEYVKAELNSLEFIKAELKDYKLDPGVSNLILEYCGDDITKILNECLKLKNYKLKDKKISKNDISDICIKKLGDPTELTFAFSRSLAERNKKEALLKYHELLDYNVEPLGIIGLLASQIRIIYQVKILLDEGMSKDEIANQLDVKAFRITKTMELLKYYSSKELLNLLVKLQKIDLQIKTTNVDANHLIEMFILNI